MDEAFLAIIAANKAQTGQQTRRSSNAQRSARRASRGDSDSDDRSLSEGDDELSGEEWVEVRTWDPDTLLGDPADRERLMQMSELDREAILAERRSKLEKLQERQEVQRMLKRRLSGQAKQKRSKEDEGGRPAKRQSTERSKWGDSIASLRREREKKSAQIKDEEGKRTRDRSASFDGNKDDVPHREAGDRNTGGSLPTFAELLSIQITRNELVDWAFAPYFGDTVRGCFVRYGLGADPRDPTRNVYRVCHIDEIRQSPKPYQVDGKPVQKAALMSHAKAQRENTFSKVSNGRFTESEYKRWVDTMRYERAPLLPAGLVQRKRADLQRAREYVLSNEEVARIVEQKRALQKVPVNMASAVPELKRRIEYAESVGDKEQRSKLQAELDHLLSLIPKPKQPATPTSANTPGARIAKSELRRQQPNGLRAVPKEVLPSAITNEWDKHFIWDPILDEIKI